jgi:hypothetical protein
MKNPRKMTAFSDMLLKLRFAEKHAFRFRHEVAIVAGCQAVGLLCTVGFREKIPLRLPSLTAC